MNGLKFAIVGVALSGLVSCGTPAERCDTRILEERRNVLQLLDEVEANIARGYAWENTTRNNSGFSFCAGGTRRGHGQLGLGYSTCYGGPTTVRERVPIDPVAEERKRDALQTRLSGLALSRTPQCVASFNTLIDATSH
ncbi:hypothetical protein E4191_23075 (plasmid) [Paracoccus liaowanqingii]|uniref:Uncharacterized protein n=2 Tax=Paracoccus liaowanqingii TaxID=2560053 RepID=A0A4Y5SU54_9RHOB|nr:hypothetical protein E4191_23075 [Paracoccus liaowanqingii]